jgi:hypothetical protein
MSPLAKADDAALPGPMARSPNRLSEKNSTTTAATRIPDTTMRFPPRTNQCIARSLAPSILRTELAVVTSSLMDHHGKSPYRRERRGSKHTLVRTSRRGVIDVLPSE